MIEGGTSRKQRALGLKDIDVEGLDLSRRTTEAHKHAERLDAVERRGEGRLAHPVIDHLAKFAAGDLLHLRDKILLAIKDRVMSAVLPRQLGLLF